MPIALPASSAGGTATVQYLIEAGPPVTVEVNNTISILGSVTVSGLLADPPTLALQVRNPVGTTTTVTLAASQVVRLSKGQYSYPWPVAFKGTHLATWSTPGAQASMEFVGI